MALFGERHVRCVIEQYVEHYPLERPHQGLGNRVITLPVQPPPRDGPVKCRERLRGLLESHCREAA